MKPKLLIYRPCVYLTITQALSICLGWSVLNSPVQAKDCPYSSYMVINGRCVNIPSSRKPARSIELQPSYYDSSDTYTESSQNLSAYDPNAKTCSDFDYQDEAQDYATKHSGSGLDGEGDGIACEYLTWRKYGYLSRYSYEEVKNEYYRRKQEQTFGFRDDIIMTIGEVQSIIGFDGHYVGNGVWIWGNILNPKEQIKIKVLNNQIVRVSKKGF